MRKKQMLGFRKCMVGLMVLLLGPYLFADTHKVPKKWGKRLNSELQSNNDERVIFHTMIKRMNQYGVEPTRLGQSYEIVIAHDDFFHENSTLLNRNGQQVIADVGQWINIFPSTNIRVIYTHNEDRKHCEQMGINSPKKGQVVCGENIASSRNEVIWAGIKHKLKEKHAFIAEYGLASQKKREEKWVGKDATIIQFDYVD